MLADFCFIRHKTAQYSIPMLINFSEVSNTTPFPSNKLNDDGSLQGLSSTRVQILWTMRLWVSVTAWSERRTSLIDYSGAFTSWIHSFKQLSSLIRAIQTHSNHYYGRVTRIPVTQIHTKGHQTEAGLLLQDRPHFRGSHPVHDKLCCLPQNNSLVHLTWVFCGLANLRSHFHGAGQ